MPMVTVVKCQSRSEGSNPSILPIFLLHQIFYFSGSHFVCVHVPTARVKLAKRNKEQKKRIQRVNEGSFALWRQEVKRQQS